MIFKNWYCSSWMLGRGIPSITQLEVSLIDVIIRNQDIKKLETTCFGLILAIFRFHLEKAFSRWNPKIASIRPKHVVSNFFVSWFIIIIISIRKPIVVLLTVSPYHHYNRRLSDGVLTVNCITNSCVWNTCVTWQGIDYKLSEDDTIVSKRVGVW